MISLLIYMRTPLHCYLSFIYVHASFSGGAVHFPLSSLCSWCVPCSRWVRVARAALQASPQARVLCHSFPPACPPLWCGSRCVGCAVPCSVPRPAQPRPTSPCVRPHDAWTRGCLSSASPPQGRGTRDKGLGTETSTKDQHSSSKLSRKFVRL